MQVLTNVKFFHTQEVTNNLLFHRISILQREFWLKPGVLVVEDRLPITVILAAVQVDIQKQL
jgi:hypothetical protein